MKETFKIDYENLDVEAVMAQIRQRVREKKGLVYSDAELEKLGGLKLPDPKKPVHKDPDRDRIEPPETPEGMDTIPRNVLHLEELITRRMEAQTFEEIQDDDFVIEATRCVGDWNIDIHLEDLYKSSPGAKGKIIEAIRSINRKLFKFTMNIDVLFPEFHKQSMLNRTYVKLFHALVKEISAVPNRFAENEEELKQLHANIHNLRLTNKQIHELITENVNYLAKDITQVDNDLKQTRAEIMQDFTNDRNHMMNNINQHSDDIKELQFKVDNLRGLIEGQRQQLEYMLARQKALESLAVLKEDDESEDIRKSSELKPGRYKAAKKSEES